MYKDGLKYGFKLKKTKSKVNLTRPTDNWENYISNPLLCVAARSLALAKTSFFIACL